MDPRLSIIENRLKDIKKVIAVAGGKGGIGKSSVAATLALILAKSDHKVGLLDLDLCGPSTHVILGIKGIHPIEEKGIIPPEIYGIKFMSIIYYAGDNPSPLRGVDISNVIIELLTITRWGSLDFLIIDMPPGIGDPTLDIIRLIKKVEFLIITTPSKVALETVKKLVNMLTELKVPIIGIIENMKISKASSANKHLKTFNVPFFGEIEFDENLEDSMGDVNKLVKSHFAEDLKETILGGITKLRGNNHV